MDDSFSNQFEHTCWATFLCWLRGKHATHPVSVRYFGLAFNSLQVMSRSSLNELIRYDKSILKVIVHNPNLSWRKVKPSCSICYWWKRKLKTKHSTWSEMQNHLNFLASQYCWCQPKQCCHVPAREQQSAQKRAWQLEGEMGKIDSDSYKSKRVFNIQKSVSALITEFPSLRATLVKWNLIKYKSKKGIWALTNSERFPS